MQPAAATFSAANRCSSCCSSLDCFVLPEQVLVAVFVRGVLHGFVPHLRVFSSFFWPVFGIFSSFQHFPDQLQPPRSSATGGSPFVLCSVGVVRVQVSFQYLFQAIFCPSNGAVLCLFWGLFPPPFKPLFFFFPNRSLAAIRSAYLSFQLVPLDCFSLCWATSCCTLGGLTAFFKVPAAVDGRFPWCWANKIQPAARHEELRVCTIFQPSPVNFPWMLEEVKLLAEVLPATVGRSSWAIFSHFWPLSSRPEPAPPAEGCIFPAAFVPFTTVIPTRRCSIACTTSSVRI
ncbi:hypothetical protein Salat_0404800 [Sesamum alatum]|uniref:Transmembrane protein n=1 Tax=Sesamum alatum TaxID=300844 RepID=A0AAE1Z202_9LAMI|nr:hypothetical protein Salat_0404800 [Sesamum alatum]